MKAYLKMSETRIESKLAQTATEDQKSALFDVLNHLNAHLGAHLQEKLVAIVQFGSTTRPTLKPETDVDVMMVFDELPSHRWSRYELFSEFENQVEKELATLHKFGLQLQFSPIYKTSSEFLKWSPLYLDWKDSHRVYFDRLSLVPVLLQKVEQWKQKNNAHKVMQGLKWYWVYGGEKGKPVELSFE